MTGRLDAVRRCAADAGASAVLVSHLPHVRWATGFSGSNALVLVTPDGAVLFTDGRYTEQARAETDGLEVVIASDLVTALGSHEGVPATVVVQPEALTLARFDALQAARPDAEWLRAEGLLSRAVATKDDAEIDALRRAQALTASVFESLLPLIGPGVSELDLAAEIVYLHLRGGASAMSFEPIVAAGPRGALPHARPSSRTFQPGDLVVIDMGGVVDGYAADMTRTVAIGPPGDDERRAYRAVDDALTAAVDRVRADVAGAELDQTARDVLAEAGLAEHFTHSLGHGVGLDVHEWPRLSVSADHVVPENACITIEPGVYLPGRFGIRIEDLVVARRDGPESLTTATRELLVL